MYLQKTHGVTVLSSNNLLLPVHRFNFTGFTFIVYLNIVDTPGIADRFISGLVKDTAGTYGGAFYGWPTGIG